MRRYNRALRDLIAGGRAEPGFIVSHDEGWTKVVLHPDGHS
ncbi:hypothetical protein [Streptomyces sp. HUAS TT20]